MSNFMSSEERYYRDPFFNSFVKMMVRAMEDQNMTPTEVRESAMMAAVIFESSHPRLPYAYPRRPEIGRVPESFFGDDKEKP